MGKYEGRKERVMVLFKEWEKIIRMKLGKPEE
jgi:hypothetical protein